MKKHDLQDINDAICRYSAYLVENNISTPSRLSKMLNESVFKRIKATITGGASRAASAVSKTAKAIGQKVHDEFAANPGVKEMMKAVSGLLKKGVQPKDIKFFVYREDTKKTYRVAKMVFSKNLKTLAFLYNDEINKKARTFEDLWQLMQKSGIKGKTTKLSDFTDSLVLGAIDGNDAVVSESIAEKAISQIAGIAKVMGWKDTKTANKEKNVKRLMAFFGLEDTIENYGDMVDAIKTAIGNANPSSNQPTRNDAAANDNNSSQPNTSSSSNDANSAKSENDMLLKTKDGNIGVMDNAFKSVKVKNNNIGIIFGKKKKQLDKEQSMSTSMGN